MTQKLLRRLYQKGILTEIDVHFAHFISELVKAEDPAVGLGAALVSHITGEGHICLDLATHAQRVLLEGKGGQNAVICPPLSEWKNGLIGSGAVGRPGENCPLILDDANRLYLYRYWAYEQNLAEAVKDRTSQALPADSLDLNLLKDGLERFFPKQDDISIDWQKIAALTAVLKPFCVISGGPGTGKTFTAAKILALLIEQSKGRKLKIFLATPTGKAAARLGESLQIVGQTLDCSAAVRDAIPVEARTIHRLLQPLPGTPRFRFNRDNPLPADVVMVDEASMVDLALMAKLIQAIPVSARLVLMGDKDQLASVEAGAVLGDLCGRGHGRGFSASFHTEIEALTGENLRDLTPHDDQPGMLKDCIVHLNKSYRFAQDSCIAKLSQALNRGDGRQAFEVLAKSSDPTVRLRPAASDGELQHDLKKAVLQGYRDYLTAATPYEAVEKFNQFTLLCTVNKGPFGVAALNHLAEQILYREDLIHPDQPFDDQWYAGRPVMITRNDYHMELFNGDIGLTMAGADSDVDRLYVYFPEAKGIRQIPVYRISGHQTVYALTVHKSQGSEFEDVHLILPDMDVPVLTRELIYTAVTRAKQTMTIWGTKKILQAAIDRKIQRSSGLRDALWGKTSLK